MRQKHPLMWALFMVAAFALVAGPGFAQTPDGDTPAEEPICDQFSGAAFGLCNAYCEAMDCHLNRPDEPGAEPPFPKASETACLKVENNWMKFMYPEPLPCEVEACPPGGGQEGCPCTDNADCADGLICGEDEACVEEPQ